MTTRHGNRTAAGASRQHLAPALEPLEPRLLLNGAVEPVIPMDLGFLGASIPSWWHDSYETTGAVSLAALADTGANFVGLTPTWYQDTLTSDAVAPDASKTATDAGLIAMITGAHAEDMLVMLKPHVDVQTDQWRGYIAPNDVDDWFASYEDFIVYYAEIAEAYGVSVFVIGTELASLSGADYADEWTAVASAVDAVYNGTVTYAANDEEYQDVSFWDAVDYVGLDAYFDLGIGAPAVDASYDDILAAWAPLVTAVDDWMTTERGTQRAIFTEIGYRSIEGAHIEPWDSWRTGTLSEQAQADCYRAALEAWTGSAYIDAMAFWAWPVDLATDVGGDVLTTGYSPYGKAAEDVLREYTYRMYPPDLVTEMTFSSRTPLPGETVTVEVTTRNIGPGPAAPATAADFKTLLFLRDAWSFDPAFTADIIGQEVYTDILAGGERTFTVTFPAPSEPGRYHVGALVDGGENVIENDEDNNLTAVDLWVNLAPVVTVPIPDLDFPVGAPQTVINLNNRFNDPDITGSVYRFVTNMGTFDVHMFDAVAPLTVANFRLYADGGDFVDSIFHRSMPDFIIQSGGFAYTDVGGMDFVVSHGTVDNEPYLSNVRGTLAMAKQADLPDSASNGWFVNLADNGPNLDYQNEGFSPYGEVIASGMDVADAIAALKIWDGRGAFGSQFNAQTFDTLPLNGYSTDQDLVQEHFVYFSSISQIAPLAFEVVANTNPSLVTPTIDGNGVLRMTYAPGQSGSARITLRATDLCGATVEDTFDVDITPPVTATASSQLPHTPAEHLVDGSGLPDDLHHSTSYADMWLSEPGVSPTLRFDLGQVYVLSGMRVWNYNQVSGTGVPLTNRGVQTADVYVSVTGLGDPTSNPAQWTLLSDDLLLAQASGDADYAGQAYGLSAGGVAAQHVLLTDMTNWGGTHTGLSEVRFTHQGTVSLGDQIDSASPAASSQLPHTPAARLVDGSGIVGGSHSTSYADMWLSESGASPTLRFDLGQAYLLYDMHVWNYNQVSGTGVPLTNRGVRTADVYVSVSGTGDPTSNPSDWTLLSDDLLFAQASGDAGYAGELYRLSTEGTAAQFVLFTDMQNWGGTATGLSEVRFNHPGAAALSDQAESVSATASSQLSHTPVEHLVDGSGLSAGSHGTHYGDMWLSEFGASATLRFDLGRAYRLSGMHVWNYNQVGGTGVPMTNRGVRTADVYVSVTGIGDPTSNADQWTLLSDDLPLPEATGDPGYAGMPYELPARGIAARYVMLTDMTNWGGTHTGLSEVQFSHLGPVPLGDLVEGVSAAASSQLAHTPVERLADGSGLSDGQHSTSYAHMWLSQPGASPTVQFDLSGVYSLSAIQVWNYNQVSGTGVPLTNRGVQTADVYVSTTGIGDPTSDPSEWTLVSDDLLFAQATGSADYAGQSYELSAEGIAAQYVLLTDITNWGGTHTGLSEVQFWAKT